MFSVTFLNCPGGKIILTYRLYGASEQFRAFAQGRKPWHVPSLMRFRSLMRNSGARGRFDRKSVAPASIALMRMSSSSIDARGSLVNHEVALVEMVHVYILEHDGGAGDIDVVHA
jgi:hypothetical protein